MATAAWGSGWRMPTKDDFDNLRSNCTIDYVTTEPKGIRFTGKDDYSANSIFLPAAGYGNGSNLINAGGGGYYWSSTQSTSSSAYNLYFNMVSGSSFVNSKNKYSGFPVRPVRSSL